MAVSQRVAVFGAGIAGLTVAHELARRGYLVDVYEPNRDAGGFFRSARRDGDQRMPSEYSWHGIGPWYHNVFDLMKEIPFDDRDSLYTTALSRPINFGTVTDDGESAFDDTRWLNVKNLFRMTWLDVVLGSWLMFKTWVADRRSKEYYSTINAADAWRPFLSDRAWKVWRATFGPWIGSDWTNVSLHTAGQFFRKQLITKPSHPHPPDADGGAWSHGPRSGWLLLKGPSNEYWFERWVRYLQKLGVQFHWQQALDQLNYDGRKITSAMLEDGRRVEADIFVLAANPFAAATIINRTQHLRDLDQLNRFPALVVGGSHTQVSLRIAFGEKVVWPRKRTAVIAADSEFNLTLFAQEQAWDPQVDLGRGVQSLWTITACVATVPGRLHRRPLEDCTKEQFLDEIKAQLFRCEGLNAMIAQANGGRRLSDMNILRFEIWHEWDFSPEGIHYHQPKWVNRTGNQRHMPTQATPVDNLLLAGAHTQTDVDVWSIEAAVESGRRAAKLLEPDVKVLKQYRPWWLQLLRMLDNGCYRCGLPNILDLCLLLLLAVLILTPIILFLPDRHWWKY